MSLVTPYELASDSVLRSGYRIRAATILSVQLLCIEFIAPFVGLFVTALVFSQARRVLGEDGHLNCPPDTGNTLLD